MLSKRINKVLSIFVTTLFLTVFFNNTVFSDDTIYTDNGLQYTIEDDKITIVYYFLDDKTVVIPRTIGLYDVVCVGEGAFKDSDVEKLYIPDTVTSILDDSLSDIELIHYDLYSNPLDNDSKLNSDDTNTNSNNTDKFDELISIETSDDELNKETNESDNAKITSNIIAVEEKNEEYEDLEVDAEESFKESEEYSKKPLIIRKTNELINKVKEEAIEKKNSSIIYLLFSILVIIVLFVVVIIRKLLKRRKK